MQMWHLMDPGGAHLLVARGVGDLGVTLGDGVEEMVVGDRLFEDGVEREEALFVESGA